MLSRRFVMERDNKQQKPQENKQTKNENKNSSKSDKR